MAARFSHFDHLTLVYKSLQNTDFQVAVLVPKNLPEGNVTCPLLVHFHGGCLVNGTTLDPAYLSEWPLELCEAKGAIFVSPEYRFMPEFTGAEILEDIGDFWAWTRTGLPAALARHKANVTLDLGRVAATGESAGGYLTLQSAFLFPEAQIRIAMAQYCGMFPDQTIHNPPPDGKPPFAEEEAILDAYLKQLQLQKQSGADKTAKLRLSTPFPELGPLCLAHLKTARRQELFGPDERLRLGYGLRTAKEIPPIWIIQGADDIHIPKAATDELVARIKKARPEVPLLYSVQPGNHGFDIKDKLSDAWLVEAMAFVEKYWP